jgi:hypothetical protein
MKCSECMVFSIAYLPYTRPEFFFIFQAFLRLSYPTKPLGLPYDYRVKVRGLSGEKMKRPLLLIK